jgi:ribosomal protein L40E
MVKFPEANIRQFRNIFICKRCKTKIRAPSVKVVEGKIKCRRCGSKALRPKRKK